METMLVHWVSKKRHEYVSKASHLLYSLTALLTLLCFLPPCSGFSVEGPSQAKIECDDKGDGSCDVRYWPTEPGEYAVHVLCNNEDIQHSPFMAEIVNPPGKDFYPDKVYTQT